MRSGRLRLGSSGCASALNTVDGRDDDVTTSSENDEKCYEGEDDFKSQFDVPIVFVAVDFVKVQKVDHHGKA